MIPWIKRMIAESAAPAQKSDLERRRDFLADELEGITYNQRMEIIENLMDDDPELYQSWMQAPYVRRP